MDGWTDVIMGDYQGDAKYIPFFCLWSCMLPEPDNKNQRWYCWVWSVEFEVLQQKKWVAELFLLPYLLRITLSKKWTMTVQAGRAITRRLLLKTVCWLLIYCWVQCRLLILFMRPLMVLRNLEISVFRDSCLFRQREPLVLGLILCLVEKYPYHFPATFISDFLLIFGLSLAPSLLSPIR